MAMPEHTNIIHKVARTIFKPYGIKRKGQSRTYLDDNEWFTTVIEFQPHSYGRGTFLNIGVNFHWYSQTHFSFDLGYRVAPFINFTHPEKFSAEIEQLCKLTTDKVMAYREELSSRHKALETILAHQFPSESLWGNYHKGTIAGLTGDMNLMNHHYNQLLKSEENIDWIHKLKSHTVHLQQLSKNRGEFENYLSDLINQTRTLKRLNDIDFSFKTNE